MHCQSFIASTILKSCISIVGLKNILLYYSYKYNKFFKTVPLKIFNKESIRLASFEAKFSRKVMKNINYNGFNMCIGDNMTVMTGVANCDKSIYGHDALIFNPNRRFQRPTIEFGFGQHICLAYKMIQIYALQYSEFLTNKNVLIEDILFDVNCEIFGSPIKYIYGEII